MARQVIRTHRNQGEGRERLYWERLPFQVVVVVVVVLAGSQKAHEMA